jgi:hypothetical protein
LGGFLHRKVRAHFDSVPLSSTNQVNIVDVDTFPFKEDANIYVLHDKSMVYVITFSSDISRHIYSGAALKTNLLVQLDQAIIQEIKAIGNSDKMQLSEDAVYTTNFGATIPPQQSTLCNKLNFCQ